jgi:hypothetical protein
MSSENFTIDPASQGKKFSIGDVSGVAEVTIRPEEHADDRASRLKNTDRQSLIEDWLGAITYVVILVGLVVIATVSGYKGMISPTTPSDTQHFCQTLLAAVVSGGISYVVGRNSRNK